MPRSTEKLVEEVVVKPVREDRRAWVRYPCDRKGTCQPIPLPTASQPEGQWGAQVRDISAGGVSLYLRRRFETGTPLTVEFPDVAGNKLLVAVEVVRVFAERGGWVLGCKLESPLREEELKALL